MILSAITTAVNKAVGRGNHAFADIVQYLDEAVDRINSDLTLELPVFSDVYANTFTKNAAEELLVYAANAVANAYTRIPDAYIRNFVVYYAATKMLQEEDEAPDVYLLRKQHADEWYQKLIAVHSDCKLADSEAIIVGDDVDEVEETETEDDTALGYYNPLFDNE